MQIPAARRPPVIFVTAHDRHALRAFEVHALDYLLKPITASRFAAALESARTAHTRSLATRTLEDLMQTLGGGSPVLDRPGSVDRLTVRDDGRCRLVAVGAIRWVEACGNYVVLYTRDGDVVHRATMTQLERQLPPRRFARIHRGTIVNVGEIAEILPLSHGDAEVRLRLARRWS